MRHRRTPPWFLLALFALLACSPWLLHPAPAAACGMCECYEAASWGSQFGDIEAPLNARLLVAAPSAGVISMRSSSRSAVAIDTTPAGADGFFWVEAQQPLTAGARYTVEVSGVAALDFEALAQSDDTPIRPGHVTIQTGKTSPICDLDRSARVTVTGLRDEREPGRRVFAQFDLTSGTHTQRVFLPFHAILNEQTADLAALTPSGNPKCTFARTFTVDDRDAPVSARVTIYDLGGNALEFPDPIMFTFGAVRGGECPPVLPPSQTQPPAQPKPAGAGSAQQADAGQAEPIVPDQRSNAGTAGSNDAGSPASRTAAAGRASLAETQPTQPSSAGNTTATPAQHESAAPAANGGGCSALAKTESSARAGLALLACACLLGVLRTRRRIFGKR